MKKIVFVFIIFVIGITIAYFMQSPTKKEKHLKVINPVDVNSEMVDSLIQRKGYGHTIGNFSFKNQFEEEVSKQTLKGKIFVAEYFFTTCGTICPKMNIQMQRVQDAYKSTKEIEILSFTVNPEVDTLEQMRMYADAHGALKGKWHFLTGEKSKLYELARKSFFVLKPAEAQNLGDAGSDFIHTNNFVLVDKKYRIRGYYDGTSAKEVDHLIEDIQILMQEKD